jgi:predicted esterase
MFIRSLLLVLCLSVAASARNVPCTFDTDIDATVVEYWHRDTPAQLDSLVCTGGDCSLSGWILDSKTDKTGNKPAIVFLHGSGAGGSDPTQLDVSNNYVCTLANHFIHRGYVIFMPYMRGYNDKSTFGHGAIFATDPHQLPGFRNTGESYATWATGQGNFEGHGYTYWTLFYMANFEMLDIQRALTFLTGQLNLAGTDLLVDPDKIAIAGHSFGGARAVLTTNGHLTPLPRAVIALSGAAMSWDTADGGDWGGFMTDAAANREMPLYLHMTPQENPNHIVNAVTNTFAAANGAEGVGESVAMLYSHFQIPDWFQTQCANIPIPDYWCAHSWFISSTVEAARWLPHVDDFLTRHGVKP